jgi:phosphoglycolate phosphatase
MTAALRLAVFDVDGTLVDSQHNIVAAMAAAFMMHGLQEPAAAAVRRVIGLSLVEAVAAVAPGLDEELHWRLAQSYKEAFASLRSQPDHDEPLFPGALEALAALEQAGWLLAIATGKSQRGVRSMLDRHDLHGRFLSIQTADEHPGKPHPSMLRTAMAELGVEPSATVMIGDTAYDMLMARNAGVCGIGVTWGYHQPDELRQAGAEVVVDTYDVLPALLPATLLGRRGCVSSPS